MPPIGLAYIASSLEKHGYSVEIMDCALEFSSQSPSGLKKFERSLTLQLDSIDPPKCIGIGPATTPALKSMYILVNVIKKKFPYIPIVYGGPFTSLPNQIPIFFDLLEASAIVRGEGEIIFPILVEAIIKGELGKEIDGVCWNKDDNARFVTVNDINSLPFPARHLLLNDKYTPSLRRNVFDSLVTSIHLSRGCPYTCNFCLSPKLRGNRLVHRNYDNLFAEMHECDERFGIKGFIFYDDCFFLKSKNLNTKVQHFCKLLMREFTDIKWEIELRVDVLSLLDEESLNALYLSGCRQINMGLEKNYDKGLKLLNKGIKLIDIAPTCDRVKKIIPDLRLAATFILGGPGETEVEINNLIFFSKTLALDFAHFYPLEVYPGTIYFNENISNQLDPTQWAYDMIDNNHNYLGVNFYESEYLAATQLIELSHKAYYEFYNRSNWIGKFQQEGNKSTIQQWYTDRFLLKPEENDPNFE